MGYPPTRSGWGTPPTRSGWGTPPTRSGWGTPRPGLDGGGVPPPRPSLDKTEQHSECLLRGGRCASCVHAGGLSCVDLFLGTQSLIIRTKLHPELGHVPNFPQGRQPSGGGTNLVLWPNFLKKHKLKKTKNRSEKSPTYISSRLDLFVKFLNFQHSLL